MKGGSLAGDVGGEPHPNDTVIAAMTHSEPTVRAGVPTMSGRWIYLTRVISRTALNFMPSCSAFALPFK